MSKERDERREKVMRALRTVDLTGVNFDSADFPVKNTATIFFTNGSKIRCGVEIYEQPGIEEAIRAIALAFLPSYHYEYQRYDPAEIDKEWKLKVEIYANGKFYTSEAHGRRKFYDLGSPAIVFRYENQGCDSYERYEIKKCHESWRGEDVGNRLFERALEDSGVSDMEELLKLIYEVIVEQLEAKERELRREELKKKVLEEFSIEELMELVELANQLEYERQERARRRT